VKTRNIMDLLLVLILLIEISVGVISSSSSHLKCVPGIEKFSSRLSPQHYYQCDDTSKEPTLLKCDPSQVYVTNEKKCISKSEVKGSGPLNDKALGRNLQLGSLFDGRENRYYPDTSFWSKKTIDDWKYGYNRKEVDTKYSTAKRVRQKISSWEVSAHFSLDLLGGLISIKGSAAYAKETIDTDTEVNVYLTYHTTKTAETLPKKTPIDHNGVCNNTDQYTHVVTSVTYGMDAVFRFHRVLHEHEFEGKISGSLGWILQAIPGLSTGHHYEFDEETESVMESSTLSMYGDFAPDEPLPATLEQAVEFYKRLPSLYETGTILDVHLTPISEFCSGVDVMLNEISNDLVAKSSDVLDELEQLGMKVRGLLKKDPAVQFEPLRKNLKIYNDAFDEFELSFKSKLKTILPNIRGGTGNGEDDLIELINEYLHSPFQFDNSSEFLVNRAREIQSIGFLTELFEEYPNIMIADYEKANDVEFIFSHDYVMILEFNILYSEDISNSFLDGNPIDESNFWYNQVEVNGQFGAMLRTFHEFALENVNTGDRSYMVKLSPLNEKLMTMHTFIKGEILSDKFEIPLTPKKIDPLDISANGFKVDVPRFNKFTKGCKYYVHEMAGNNLVESEQMFSTEGDPAEMITIDVTGLSPLTQYSFTLQYITEMGETPTSSPMEPFLTSGCSEPQNVAVEKVDYQSFIISWKPPAVIAEEITEQLQYKIKVFGVDDKDDGFTKEMITAEHDAHVDGLVDAAKYTVSVSAFVADYEVNIYKHVMVESLSSTAVVFTSPLPPTVLDAENIGMESLTLRWIPPSEVAMGSSVQEYSIEYVAMDENATEAIEGSAKKVYITNPNEQEVKITNLRPGLLYSFSSKIFTSEGESKTSMGKILRTQFNQSEVDEARENAFNNVNNTAAEMKKRSRFCGFKAETNDQGEIEFDSIYLEDNNVAGAQMSGGLFQAGASGIYQVMTNIKMTTSTNEQHWLWVTLNGVKLEESRVHTKYNIYSMGEGTDNTGREVLVVLNTGDTLGVEHESDGSNGSASVNLCVSSLTFV